MFFACHQKAKSRRSCFFLCQCVHLSVRKILINHLVLQIKSMIYKNLLLGDTSTKYVTNSLMPKSWYLPENKTQWPFFKMAAISCVKNCFPLVIFEWLNHLCKIECRGRCKQYCFGFTCAQLCANVRRVQYISSVSLLNYQWLKIH